MKFEIRRVENGALLRVDPDTPDDEAFPDLNGRGKIHP